MYFSIYVKRENKLPPSFFPLLLPIYRLSTVAELHTLIAHVPEWKCFAHSAIQWDKRCGKVTKICEKANTKAHTYTHVHVNREKVKKSYNSSVKENKQNKLKETKKKKNSRKQNNKKKSTTIKRTITKKTLQKQKHLKGKRKLKAEGWKTNNFG